MTRIIQPESAPIREIRGKTFGRVRPGPTYSRLLPPGIAKREQSRPIPSQSDLVGASGTYWDSKKVKTPPLFVTPVSRPASSRASTPGLSSLCLDSCLLVFIRGSVPFAQTHRTAQFSTTFALMCTSVHLRAPSCGKTKKSKMVHKPHISAHPIRLAPTCTRLHQLAEKKIARFAFYDMKVRFCFSL